MANPDSDILLARAVLCRAFELGLQSPSTSLLEAFSEGAARDALRQAAVVLDGASSNRLSAAMADVFEAWPSDLPCLEAEYGALFGHTLRGAVCPYESEIGLRGALQQAQHLANLGGFYHAFGLESGRESHQRLDHVACELEFLEFLSRKEAWARDGERREIVEVTAAATLRFLRDHLGRFGRAFARNLLDVADEGFYRRLAAAFEVFLEGECRRLGVPIGLAVLQLRSWESDAVPMACESGADPLGLGEDLVQLGGLES